MLAVSVEVPIRDVLRSIEDFEEARKAGLMRVATHLQNIAVRQVGRIYARPIARRKNGAPMWERTGDLAKAVAAASIWDKEAVELRADLEYANRRHELGVSWQPKKPALGIVRRNPFFAETKEITAPQVADLFADGFNEIWEKG